MGNPNSKRARRRSGAKLREAMCWTLNYGPIPDGAYFTGSITPEHISRMKAIVDANPNGPPRPTVK